MIGFVMAHSNDPRFRQHGEFGFVHDAIAIRYPQPEKASVFFARVMALWKLVGSGAFSSRYYTPPTDETLGWLDDRAVHLAARFPVSDDFSFDSKLFLQSLQEEEV